MSMGLLTELNGEAAAISAFGGGLLGSLIGFCTPFLLEHFKFGFKKRELLFQIRVDALHALNALNKNLFDVDKNLLYGYADDDKYWAYLSILAGKGWIIKRDLKDFQERYDHILPKKVDDAITKSLSIALAEDLEFGIEGVDSEDKAKQTAAYIESIKTSLNEACQTLYQDLIA